MLKEQILIVEDDADIGELECSILEDEGYAVEFCVSAEDAEKSLAKKIPSLIILDLMLPGKDGLSFCRWLRKNERTEKVPVIMVSARQEESKIVAGLEIGADDYVTKPFSSDVLMARVRAVLRRSSGNELDSQGGASKTILMSGAIELDTSRVMATVAGESITLTLSEFKILELLMRRQGMVFTRSQIVDLVHGTDYAVTERAVDVQIVGLRKKLGDAAGFIETVRGIGYRWRV